MGARGSVGRAFGSHPRGRGFESLRVHIVLNCIQKELPLVLGSSFVSRKRLNNARFYPVLDGRLQFHVNLRIGKNLVTNLEEGTAAPADH